MSFQNIVIGGGGLVVQRVINGFGFLFVAGITATNKLYGIFDVGRIQKAQPDAHHKQEVIGISQHRFHIRRAVGDNKLYGILDVAASSFGFSVATFAGQNLGANKLDRIRQGTRSALTTNRGSRSTQLMRAASSSIPDTIGIKVSPIP